MHVKHVINDRCCIYIENMEYFRCIKNIAMFSNPNIGRVYTLCSEENTSVVFFYIISSQFNLHNNFSICS